MGFQCVLTLHFAVPFTAPLEDIAISPVRFPSAHAGPFSDVVMKATPRVCIQITFSGETGFYQMTYPTLLSSSP